MAKLVPRLYLNGRQLNDTAAANAPVLAPATLTWGAAGAYDQPDPDNLKFTLLFKESMFDVPDLVKGAEVELQIVTSAGWRTVFAGRIRTMDAAPSSRYKGGLEVNANATGHKADLNNIYVSTNWGQGTNRTGQINAALVPEDWYAYFPENTQESAQAVYNSVKITTMIERYISRYRGKAFETSYRNSAGELQKRLTIMPGTARSVEPDKLLATPVGVWNKTYNAPTIGGEESQVLQLPAANALQNPSWSQEPDNAITAARLQVMEQGDDGFTTLAERNYRASSALREKYGTQTVEFETDLLAADWADTANSWMTSDSPWKMSDLTIHDSDLMDELELADLLASNTRYKTLIVVTGIMANRPDPGPSDLRSYLLGGTYEWTGKEWVLGLTLERTITALTGAGDYWTCAIVGASNNPDIANATCASVGPNLTVGDFLFIGAP